MIIKKTGQFLNLKVYPNKSLTLLTLIVFFLIFFVISFFAALYFLFLGAWPVSIFLGVEYLLIVYLIKLYFKEKNIKDEISINEKEISVKKFKGDKLLKTSTFNTYWSKIFFTKHKNQSKLSIRESDKETEVASFLHADLKEGLYLRIKRQLTYY